MQTRKKDDYHGQENYSTMVSGIESPEKPQTLSPDFSSLSQITE